MFNVRRAPAFAFEQSKRATIGGRFIRVEDRALLQIVGGDKLIIPLLMELHMNPFKGRHFQRDIILWAVRWYRKYGISYRELQEMLAERGVNVDHSTIYRWVQRYAPEMENGCAGTGVTLPIFARGTWMKPT